MFRRKNKTNVSREIKDGKKEEINKNDLKFKEKIDSLNQY